MTFIECLTNTLLVQVHVGQFKDLCTSLPYILYEIFLEIIRQFYLTGSFGRYGQPIISTYSDFKTN